ncbi:uncharacterized protein LOC135199967 [Macrobrachium nipponense]|uniref:uncharacterized protein LOC135199967 n=1 Tax=Macrobrachium nipponense TaxID=159736 RepID=UPI0030C87CEE
MIFQIRPVAMAMGSCRGKASTLLCGHSKVALYTPLTSRLSASPVCATIVVTRDYHSYKLSKHTEFFTASDVPIPKDTIEVAKILSTKDRPLTLLFCWLMAKDRHIRKYADFYNRQGIDVLGVKVSPFEVLRPTKGVQLVADEVLDFLHANPSHTPMLIHGLSVGAYMFGEVMVKMKNDMEKHGPLLNRFVGQIWDSGVDLQGIPEGLPTSLTSHEGLRASMRKYLEWYMRLKYKTATVHYESASVLVHENFLNTPALVMFSNRDPISTPAMNAVIYNKWEAKGLPVYTKCFNGSPHVSHYMMHRKEYEETILAFMEKVGMVEPAVQEASSV